MRGQKHQASSRRFCVIMLQSLPGKETLLQRKRVRMPIIEALDLTKIYHVSQKQDGLLGALRGLYRREYREVRAVDGVSFAIEPGEMLAFLGPNGAGKTTTLKMLSGLIYPTT